MDSFDQIMDEVKRRADEHQSELIARCLDYLIGVRVKTLNKVIGRAAGSRINHIPHWARHDHEYAQIVADYIRVKRLLGYRSKQRDFLGRINSDAQLVALTQEIERLEKLVLDYRSAKRIHEHDLFLEWRALQFGSNSPGWQGHLPESSVQPETPTPNIYRESIVQLLRDWYTASEILPKEY